MAARTPGRRSQLGLFAIVVGFALLLSGIGFAILAIGGALRKPETQVGVVMPKRTPAAAGPPAPIPTG